MKRIESLLEIAAGMKFEFLNLLENPFSQTLDFIGVGEGEGRKGAEGKPPPRLEVIRAILEHIRANLKIFGQT